MENTQTHCWSVKNGRPDSIPECQDMSSLPHLGENETSCGEEGSADKCFYFRCTTCMPFLALDHYNPLYKNKIEFIPRIDSIKPKDKKQQGLFKDHPGYHGEIVDFYGAYLSFIEGLSGIGINSWTSENAALIFDGVEDTFKGSEFSEKKNFEIDWLLFLENSLNVIEVGRRNISFCAKKKYAELDSCSDNRDISDGTKKLIAEKTQQIIKDYEIVKKLLAATKCYRLQTNFFIVLPNIPIEEIRGQLDSNKRSIDSVISAGIQL